MKRTAGLQLLLLPLLLQQLAAVAAHDHAHHQDEPAADVTAAAAAATTVAHRGGHVHYHGEPKLHLNESEVLRQHGPSPLSYFELDSGGGNELFEQFGSHAGLMTAHVVLMTLAFVIFLPLLIYLRAAKHAFLAGLAQVAFLATFTMGLLCSLSYSAATPELYAGQVHTKLGWIIYLLAIGLSSAQIVRACFGLFGSENKTFPFTERIRRLLSSSPTSSSAGQEYELVASPDALDEQPDTARTLFDAQEAHGETFETRKQAAVPRSVDYWRRPHRQQLSVDVANQHWPTRNSHDRASSSESTLHDGGMSPGVHSPPLRHGTQEYPEPKHQRARWLSKESLRGFLKYGEIFSWRLMVLLGWAAFITGGAVYGGACRASYGNGCMAHTIKGSIFFWYGLLTFGRYCGAWAELGWAWNRKPNVAGTWREAFPSAETIECFVIWLYGATNTWMERFGAAPGDPWSVKEVQHVSIAVMFFFAGGAGMLLESRSVRSWISNGVTERVQADNATAPSSYTASFNIFPALCIGITGIAMSAHQQEYVFSVSIHALWGILLAGFSVFRILTYTFLYLRPPASILPSRPPTEALAAFCLAAGGIVFISSTEEIVFWAMRHGADDMMAFLNVTVAFVCAVFAWILALMAVKGWATKRTPQALQLSSHMMRKLNEGV